MKQRSTIGLEIQNHRGNVSNVPKDQRNAIESKIEQDWRSKVLRGTKDR